MEAMKRTHQDQITNKDKSICNLEEKISSQEDYIAQIQRELQKDKQYVQEEKSKLRLSKEGTTARIHYLEAMLRTLQTEAKGRKTPSDRRNGSDDDEDERKVPSTPVFMLDLTSTLQGVDTIEGESSHDTRIPNNIGGAKSPSVDAETSKLIEQIAALGSSLEESETQRANLLDQFQRERKRYMSQYKQMSDLLKQIIEAERINQT